MLKTQVLMIALVAGLVALVSCQDHHVSEYQTAGYASYPNHHYSIGGHHASSGQRLKQKLRHLKYDPKVQTGIQAIKPAVGYAASMAQPVINSALRKANDWSNKHSRYGNHYQHHDGAHYAAGHQGAHYAAHAGAHHLPGYGSGSVGHHADYSHHQTSVHY